MALTTSADCRAAFSPVVENGNWGATSLAAIRAVLTSAGSALMDAFGKQPDAPVHVVGWRRNPQLFHDLRPYEIRLSARDTYWCQYVYQFSRELCHVMTNFDRCKEHRHKWFEESLCELASLFVLHRLAEVWRTHPPSGIAGASDFALNHGAYAREIAAKYFRAEGKALPEWLAGNIEALEANPLERDLTGVVAVALLDRFRRDPALWRDCGTLNRWDPRANVTFSEYLDSWAACLRQNGSEAVTPAVIRGMLLPRHAPSDPH